MAATESLERELRRVAAELGADEGVEIRLERPRLAIRLERPVGRLAISPTMEVVQRDGRIVIAYVQNDLGGAFARDSFGNYEYQCVPGDWLAGMRNP